MTTTCPHCISRIVWKESHPNSTQLNCMRCGENWNEPFVEKECEYGFLLGDWDKVEVYKLELQLRCDKPSKDWYLLKGRRVWTAWRNWWEAKDVIVVTMLDDLIYWVGKEANDPHWRKEYNS